MCPDHGVVSYESELDAEPGVLRWYENRLGLRLSLAGAIVRLLRQERSWSQRYYPFENRKAATPVGAAGPSS